MPEATFFPDAFLAKLAKKLSARGGPLQKYLDALTTDFGELGFLAKHYVVPMVQPRKPVADRRGETKPAFAELNRFLSRPPTSGQAHHRRTSLFLLGDAGTGKTSLLLLLKAAHLTGLWTSPYGCELKRLGPSLSVELEKIKTPQRTVLLLDALNEDPRTKEDLVQYVKDLLDQTAGFHRVIIACRTSYFESLGDAFDGMGALVSGAFRAPTLYLTPFAPKQGEAYLKRRYQRMKDPARAKAQTLLDSLGALHGRPLLYHHVEVLLRAEQTNWNSHTLFESVITDWLDREKGRLRGTDRSLKFTDDELWAATVRLAQQMASSPTRHVTKLTALDVKDRPLIEKLETQGRSLLRKPADESYRFTHVAFQEFVLALGARKGLLPPGKQRLPATAFMIQLLIEADDPATAWRALELSRTGFRGVELRGADFSRTSLERTDFSSATLHQPSFEQAILTEWSACQACFHGGQFQGAKATFSRLREAKFLGGRWSNATLASSNLRAVRFEMCEIHHTLMADTDLRGAQFDGATISDSSFKGAWLHRASFRNCELRQTRFDHARLGGASFADTKIDQVSLQGADLRGAQVDRGFIQAIRDGQVKQWKTAAWDQKVADTLKLSSKENARNAATIDRS